MKYFNFFYNILQYYPTQIFFISIVIVLASIIKLLYSFKNVSLNYKIYNFYLNSFFIFIYIIIFIGILYSIRLLRLGLQLNLIDFFLNTKTLLFNLPYIYILVCLELIIIVFLLIIKSRKFFYREITKAYLFYYYYLLRLYEYEIDKNKNTWKFFIYRIFVKYRHGYNYYILLVLKPICYIIIPLKKYFNIKEKRLNYYEKKAKKLPLILLILSIFYDIIFNSFTIHYTFYYLAIYFPIMLWVESSTFIHYTCHRTNTILHEHYYATHQMLFIGLTDEVGAIFVKYIKEGFISPLLNSDYTEKLLSDDELDHLIALPSAMRHQHSFLRLKDTPNIYLNHYIDYYIDLDDEDYKTLKTLDNYLN